jgi:CYTH domain-containing protein
VNGPTPDDLQSAPWEIERVFLLDGRPQIPAGAEVQEIEQGYLAEGPPIAAGRSPAAAERALPAEGRIRRTTLADGSMTYAHTIKRGEGRVRRELETPITQQQFAALWPATLGRRLRKTRSRVREGDLSWESDDFHDLNLVLAEVELPEQGTPIEIPPWIQRHVVREVTEEPQYRNFSIAQRIGVMTR